ncbi:hypothetical protein ACWGPD_10020 [Streptomyces hirsutus]|uniref:hypothetical protein n=1 Tax=Streptomyces hirsutus TaxID=35620 RepID=UPI00362F0D51
MGEGRTDQRDEQSWPRSTAARTSKRAASGESESLRHEPGAAGTGADLLGKARHLVYVRFPLHEVAQGATDLVAQLGVGQCGRILLKPVQARMADLLTVARELSTPLADYIQHTSRVDAVLRSRP